MAPLRISKTEKLEDMFRVVGGTALSIGKVAASKLLMNDKGSIVLMSSVAAVTGTAGMASYSATKGAIEAISRSMAIELSIRNIRVNTITAGAVKTEMHERLQKRVGHEAFKEYEKKHPLGFGKTEDIADVATFLISDASKWITGSSVRVDGGYSAT